MTIFQIRQINGCLTRVPERFYSNLWDVLSRSPGGFIIGHVLIPQQPTLTNMKRYGEKLLITSCELLDLLAEWFLGRIMNYEIKSPFL